MWLAIIYQHVLAAHVSTNKSLLFSQLHLAFAAIINVARTIIKKLRKKEENEYY